MHDTMLTEDDITDLRREFNLSPMHGKMLGLLLANKYITDKDLVGGKITSGGSSPKVEISRLRKRMNPHGVKILSMRNMGYWLTDTTKADILGRLPARVSPPDAPRAALPPQ